MTVSTAEHIVTPVVREWSENYTMQYGVVPLARIRVRRHLTVWRWGGDVEDATGVVSELLANAVVHTTGHASVDTLLKLRLAVLRDGVLLVQVSDPRPDFPNFGSQPEADEYSEGGRGLFLVLHTAEQVEWFPNAQGGKTVRARLRGTGG